MKNEINTKQAGFTPYTIFLNAIEAALALGTSGNVKDMTKEEKRLRALLAAGRNHDLLIARFTEEFQVNPLQTLVSVGERCEIAAQYLNFMARLARYTTFDSLTNVNTFMREELTNRMIGNLASASERAAIAEFLAA